MQLIPVHRVRSDTEMIQRPEKFHVRLTKGRFQTIRRFISTPLIVAFFALAWLQWDGQPLAFFSFAERRIFLFGAQISWHDLPLLAGMMIAGACLLFFMAVGWGRVWCGFACPQSIWTWLFIRIEDLVEGRANVRAKNDLKPLTGMRLLRRVIKHSLWLAFALLTTLTFTGYFIPVRELFSGLLQAELSLAVWGWLICMSALTYFNAGLVREKICLHACPYSRFQGVMFDRYTQTVSYDAARGEPRRQQGARSTPDTAAPHAQGGCVDCTICVQVCPVGIDIRDGLQAACIDCGACIDACDQVMDKIGAPRGLIRFASEYELADPHSTDSEKNRSGGLLRPKLLGYACVMLVALSAVGYGFTQTRDLLVEVSRDRGALYTYLDNNTVCNHYRLKVEAYQQGVEKVTVRAEGLSNLRIYGDLALSLDNNNAGWRAYRVCAPAPEALATPIRFVISGGQEGHQIAKTTTFLTGSR